MPSADGRVPLAIRAYGDAGLLVDVRSDDAEQRWTVAQDLGTALLADPPTGLTDVVAAYETVFVAFDPLLTDHAALTDAVLDQRPRPTGRGEPRELSVPVRYGGAHGPDLDLVADELGVTPDALVALHTGSAWTVRFRGSPVGAPFLDGPVLPGSVSRNPRPRTRVPPGSVGLSGQQSMVYPVASPGGWRLVGRTPLRLVDPTREGLVGYRPGDRLRFVAVDDAAFAALDGELPAW